MSNKPHLRSCASLAKSPKRALKSVLITTLLIATTASVVLLSGCNRSKGKLSDIAQLAPANSLAIVAYDGLDDVIKQAADTLGNLGQFAALMPPESAGEIATELLSATATLGFDPTDPTGYADIGLNLSRPLAAIVVPVMGSPEPTILVAIPVSDQEVFNSFVGRISGAVIQEQTISDQTIYYMEGAPVCWSYKNNYLLANIAENSTLMESGLVLASALNSSSTLRENESFQKMDTAMGSNWSLMAWLNVETMEPMIIAETRDPMAAPMLDLAGVQSVALNLSDDKGTISVNTAVQFDDGSRILEYLNTIDASQDDALSEQLSGSPIAIARMSLNLPALLEIVRSIPYLQEDLMDMSQELAEEGFTIDQLAGLVPSTLGGALFFGAAGGEYWIGGGVDGDTTALTSMITRECDTDSHYRETTLQPIANGVACITERRGTFEGLLTSQNIAAIVGGEAMGEPAMLQVGIMGRLMGLGGDAEGYGNTGLSDAASQALNARGIASAYFDIPAAIQSLSTNPEFLREAGAMGVMGLGMMSNALTEGVRARAWVDGGMLNASASISLEGMELEGGAGAAATMGVLLASSYVFLDPFKSGVENLAVDITGGLSSGTIAGVGTDRGRLGPTPAPAYEVAAPAYEVAAPAYAEEEAAFYGGEEAAAEVIEDTGWTTAELRARRPYGEGVSLMRTGGQASLIRARDKFRESLLIFPRYAQAQAKLEEVMMSLLNSATVEYRSGQQARDRGDNDRARGHYQQVITLVDDPSHSIYRAATRRLEEMGPH